MTTIYFIRHAQPWRGANSPYTDATYPLSDKGQADVALVTQFLQDKNVDVVLSSPFKRAYDTVAPFAQQAGLEVEIIEDFRERKISNGWIEDFETFAKNQWEDENYKLSDGESIAEVTTRKLAALQKILQKYDGKTIAVGSHGMAISVLLRRYNSEFGYEQHRAMPMPYVVKMVFDKGVCFDVSYTNLFGQVEPDYQNIRVETTELDTLKAYRFTVIFAQHDGKWLYCRHKNRDVFETAGGHIEPGETPLQGAERELREETGATKFDIAPAFDYAVYTDTGFANGQVFIADIHQLGKLEYEMSEVRGFDTIPDKMRFPKILPVLFERVRKQYIN